ncbi:MAG: menaquinone biosynthesis decarboxylase [Deltaproteobacteria bacterium]|nr:menaquinone biosynthesis decarboxylase [Deltaproteobacteria bacterium]
MAPFASLRDFVRTLETHRELVRVPHRFSPRLEVAALADLAMKSAGGGKALLFENVEGSSVPVLVNAFGSRRRLALALGADAEEIGRRLDGLLHLSPPSGLAEALRLAPRLFELRGVLPRRRKGRPPCQEVVLTGEAVDLTRLPVLTCWPGDGGPFVTLPCVVTKDPETGRQNMGMYRLQIFDRNTTGMHWHLHKDGSLSHRAHVKRGARMEVAAAIGTDPVVTYCATAPLPRGVDEMMFAGFVRKAPVELARCVTVDLWVPAGAEFVLEGYVLPGEERVEGPFGDHTGVYSPAEPYPVFHVTAVTHRREPIYSATVVGIPPMEDAWLGWATERLFLPLLKTQWPEVVELHLPAEGVFHNLCLASLDKTYPLQARRLFQGFWGSGQMSFTKIVAAFDADVDVRDGHASLRAALDRIVIPEDLVFSEGVLDALDHSSPHALWGGKLGVDATRKLSGEPGADVPRVDRAPRSLATPQSLADALSARFPGLRDCRVPAPEARLLLALLVLDKSRPGEGSEVALAAVDLGVDVAVAVEGRAADPTALLAWRVLSSVDPTRDVRVVGRRVAVDATAKGPAEGHSRTWPDELAHPPEVRTKVGTVARELSLT